MYCNAALADPLHKHEQVIILTRATVFFILNANRGPAPVLLGYGGRPLESRLVLTPDD